MIAAAIIKNIKDIKGKVTPQYGEIAFPSPVKIGIAIIPMAMTKGA